MRIRADIRAGLSLGFVWVCLSVSIHGIGNGEQPNGGRKGHRGGTRTCMQSRQQFYILGVTDMCMKPTCRGAPAGMQPTCKGGFPVI